MCFGGENIIYILGWSMVDERIKRLIDGFISTWLSAAQNITGKLRTEYIEVEDVQNIDYIMSNYIDDVLNLNDSERERILDIMQSSLSQNSYHKFWGRWFWVCIGIARYLLPYNLLNEINETKAADVIVRISRWRHTRNNFWIRFKPYAQEIVSIIWGDIENLYYMRNIH